MISIAKFILISLWLLAFVLTVIIASPFLLVDFAVRVRAYFKTI